ncbi:hypothetical protein I308_102287 [Cryptococcus tetragattii IND107]|uniref:Uncharacterized protein n=1 Tax=Cryptococcus tetragattii IND107 TaxID=1296105 RepID=A0ABR3BWY5_9TREE
MRVDWVARKIVAYKGIAIHIQRNPTKLCQITYFERPILPCPLYTSIATGHLFIVTTNQPILLDSLQPLSLHFYSPCPPRSDVNSVLSTTSPL